MPSSLKPNLLTPIPYFYKGTFEFIKSQGDHIRFLIDSGAFTAFKVGKEITLDDYCKFLEDLPFEPFGYFTLDKIGDHIATKKQFYEIKRRGFSPIPIFTRGSPWEDLEEWCSQSEVVGVGGGNGQSTFKLFVRDVMRRLKDKPHKIHWLGFTDRDFIAHWKPFSCDCSNAGSAVRYHRLFVYDFKGKLIPISHKEFRDDTANACAKARSWFEWCEEDLYSVRGERGWSWKGVADMVTRKAWAHYAIDCERFFGTKIFIADQVQYFQSYVDAWWFVAEKTKLLKRPEFLGLPSVPDNSRPVPVVSFRE